MLFCLFVCLFVFITQLTDRLKYSALLLTISPCLTPTSGWVLLSNGEVVTCWDTKYILYFLTESNWDSTHDLIGQKPMVYYIDQPGPKKKATRPRAIHKTGYWSANNDFRKAQKQNNLFIQPFLILKSVGFHLLLPSVTICYWHSFKSYKVQSWKAVYFSRRCQIAEKANNCMNFWCRKSLEKLDHAPTGNKPDSFSILNLFYVKIKFLNEKKKVPKRDLIKFWYKIGRCRL